jgi:hypothetical protein
VRVADLLADYRRPTAAAGQEAALKQMMASLAASAGMERLPAL